ncbi:MAG TPA: HAMP domain-containing sensor histidine kinase [Myxococcales bacterium]|nr:HAMP domain-containing sensor histidine kinase [Myxococcales bacterium]
MRRRLVLQIYGFSLAVLICVVLGLVLLTRLSREVGPPGMRERAAPFARYALSKVTEHWGDPAAMRAEAERLRTQVRLSVTVFRYDGTVVATGGDAPAEPLGAEAVDSLRRRGVAPETLCRGPLCAMAFPVQVQGQESPGYGVVSVELPRELLSRAAVPTVLVLCILGAASVVFARGLARPLGRLAEVARALGRGELSVRSGLRRRDELGDVARAFDEMAERINALLRAQTELLANVSHELRTPLSRIRVALDLASESEAGSARESLAEIGTDLDELEQLVSDILAAAKLDLGQNRASGGPPLKRQRLSSAELIQKSADRFRARHPGRELQIQAGEGLPALEGDAALLQRVVDNLLDNARKYSDADQPVTLRAEASGGGLVVEVRDRGIGIDPEDLPKLFTPFFRTDRSRSRASGGVGLGLAMARRIVEAHGGTVTAESRASEGTTLRFTLPAAPG